MNQMMPEQCVSSDTDDLGECSFESRSDDGHIQVYINSSDQTGKSSLQVTRGSGVEIEQARASLGLHTDQPIVMSGHQPILFHGGIAAKLIALDEIAQRSGAQAVWIIPDQDTVDPRLVRLAKGRRESLEAVSVQLFEDKQVQTDVPSGFQKAADVSSSVWDQQSELSALAEWIDQFGVVDTLAQQVGYGVIEYLCERLGITPPVLIFASELGQVPGVQGLVELMVKDPTRCVASYNKAVLRNPEAKVRQLMVSESSIELPLWGCRKNEQRIAITTENIQNFEIHELVPRGLFMSAICRAYLSDFFIHGLGGELYDQISEQWFEDWVGIKLSLMIAVSADLRADFGFQSHEQADLERVKYEAHHVNHTPSMLGDHDLQMQKDQLVERIHSAPRRSADRQAAYRELVVLLRAYREKNADQIFQYTQRVLQTADLSEQIQLSRERTWPMICFDQDAIRSLDLATRKAIG